VFGAADKRVAGLLALLLACTFAYFVGPPAWNQNSRLALTRALVEQGRVAIDDYHATTGDKSYRDGHFYSDKAPGVSLLAVVPYALFVVERKLTGGELPDVRVQTLDPVIAAGGRAPPPAERLPGDVLVYNPAHRVALWWCRMVVISLPSVLAAVLMFLVLVRERSRGVALGIPLIWLLATPALGYACGFYGHQIVAALLVIAWALVRLGWPLDPARRGFVLGSLLGLAVACEYTSAPAIVLVLAWASWRAGLRVAAFAVLGGIPWALLLAGYHAWAFGSPLATGYDFVYLEEFAEGMAVNYGSSTCRRSCCSRSGASACASSRATVWLASSSRSPPRSSPTTCCSTAVTTCGTAARRSGHATRSRCCPSSVWGSAPRSSGCPGRPGPSPA
jgi:hypothetical protein